MDLRSLLDKLDLLDSLVLSEDVRLKNIIAQTAGKEGNDKERFAALRQIATKEGLPGLYDPVSGKYITIAGGVEDTAPKEEDKRLAYMGLIPDNAATSTFWGRVFGTSGKDYDTELRTTSKGKVAAQDREELEAEELEELKRILPKYLELKNKTKGTRRRQQADGGQGGQGGQPAVGGSKDPNKYVTIPLSNGWQWREYGDGQVHIFDPSKTTDYLHSVEGHPGVVDVGTIYNPPRLPAGVTKVKESFVKSNLAQQLLESFDLAEEEESGLTTLRNYGMAGAFGAGASKALAGKAMPGVAIGIGAYDTYERVKKGDFAGAGLAALSTALCFVPGFGWIPATMLDSVNLWRDIKASQGKKAAEKKTPEKTTPSSDSDRLKELQIIVGAKPTGVWDPETKKRIEKYQQENQLKVTGVPDQSTLRFANINESIDLKHVLKEEASKPPIYFYLDGQAYVLLGTGALYNSEGVQVDGNTLEPIEEPIQEETAGTAVGKAAAEVAPEVLSALQKVGPEAEKFIAKNSDALAAATTKAGAKIAGRKAGDIIDHGGKEYMWVDGKKWAEVTTLNNKPKIIKYADDATNKAIENGIQQGKLKPTGTTNRGPIGDQTNKVNIPASQRKASGDPDWKVTQQDIQKAQPAATQATTDTAAAAEKTATGATKAAAEKTTSGTGASAEKQATTAPAAAEKTATGTGAAAEKSAAGTAAAGEKAATSAAAPVASTASKVWKTAGDAYRSGKIGKLLGIATVGGVLVYGTNEYDKWKAEHPGEPDPEGTEYPDGSTADGQGGKGGKGGGKTGAGGQADVEPELSPEEQDDLENFSALEQRVNALIADLSKTTNPEVRKALSQIKDQMQGVTPTAPAKQELPPK